MDILVGGDLSIISYKEELALEDLPVKSEMRLGGLAREKPQGAKVREAPSRS